MLIWSGEARYRFPICWLFTLKKDLLKKIFFMILFLQFYWDVIDVHYCISLRHESESESGSVVSDSLRLHELSSPWNSPGQNTGVASRSLLQGIFPTQGSNPGVPLCRRILYQLSHNGRPRILEWVAQSFSSCSSWPRNRTGVFWIASRFFTNWAIREAPSLRYTT